MHYLVHLFLDCYTIKCYIITIKGKQTEEIITADLEKGEVKKRGQYKVKLLGDYSDCAVFEEVA